MAKQDYLKLYNQFQEYEGKLSEFCKTKRPHLKYDATRIAFMRLERTQAKSNGSEQIKEPKSNIKEPEKKQQIRTYKQSSKKKKTNKTVQNNSDKIPVVHTLQVPTIKTVAVQVVDEDGQPLDIVTVNMPADPSLKQQWIDFAEAYVNEKLTPGQAYQKVYGQKNIFIARSSASELLARPVVADYIYYLRCVKAAKDQVRLEEINNTRKMFVDTTIFDFGEVKDNRLYIKNSDEIDREKAKVIKSLTTKREIRVEKGQDPQDGDYEIIKEEIKIELHDKLKAMADEEKSRKDPLSANTKYNDPEIAELWSRFRNQGFDNSLSALDLAHELSSRGLAVPLSIQTQAKFELSVDDPEKGDGTGFDFETLNNRYEEYQKNLQEQVEIFIPERKSEIKALYLEQGFDGTEKPKDITIDEDNIVDPDK
ncbi:terminase small subunit [bacterium]|nr:terminase small subunit [bacterium]